MLLKNLTFVFCAAILFAACGSDTSKTTGAGADGKHFGTNVTPENAIAFGEVMNHMGSVDSMPMKVAGTVGEVCQTKGCWMTIVPSQPGLPEMRVTFKDYAFFMPKDLAGKRVIVDGYAYMETTPVDMLRHYAEDAGKSKEEIAAITEPKRELSFEASGVLILD